MSTKATSKAKNKRLNGKRARQALRNSNINQISGRLVANYKHKSGLGKQAFDKFD